MCADAKFKLAAVREVLAGVPIAKVARKFEVSRQSLYLWFARYKGSQSPASLNNKYLRGRDHPKSLSWNAKRAILDMVVRSPQLGVPAITRELRRRGVLVSTFGVWRTLARYNLQVRELREQFSQKAAGKTAFAHRVGTGARIEAVREYLRGGKSVSSICRKFLVTRKTFYSWLWRYQNGPDDKYEALSRKYRRGYDHPQCKTGHLRERILEIVANNPQFSVHRLHPVCKENLGESAISHQALQNLLVREGLNTYDSRKAYAKQRAEQTGVSTAPLYVPQLPIYRLRMLLAPFVTIPKLILANPSRGLLLLPLYCGPFLLFIFWIWILTTARTGTPIGIFFASIALTFGFLFFIYSIKYYLAVILVLRLAQSGAGAADSSKLGEYFAQLFKFKPRQSPNLLLANLEKVELEADNRPFVSIHVAVYNEKKVVERLIKACTAQEWFSQSQSEKSKSVNFEVIIADDSTDETMEIAREVLLSMDYSVARERYDPPSPEATEGQGGMEIFRFGPPPASPLPTVKIIHRFARAGFKGGALQKALEETNPRAEYIVILDADFVPYPDTIEQFVKTFQVLAEGQRGSRIAAVQGYQWHVLNKSQNWVTRGVRTEYAGSYVIERSGEEIYQGLKQIAGSVYCIRADILRAFGWGTSITEDFELTLRLYEAGYKVAFTPYIQAPAEAVSTIKRLIRQRMRWAEGASFNVKVMLGRMLFGKWEETSSVIARSETTKQSNNEIAASFDELRTRNDNQGRVWVPSKLTLAEKLEFLYLAPYYLQAAFFVIGTLSWFLAEAVLGSRLPFWTAALGWSLVFTNLLALPLMNIVGMFLEESEERDYIGILSFIALSYIVVPFQAYAAIKGFLEKEEGPWFRTPKTGAITDVVKRMGGFHLRLWPFGQPAVAMRMQTDGKRMEATERMAYVPLWADNFRIRPRHIRWVGNFVLGFVVTITVLMSIFAPLVPVHSDSFFSQEVYAKEITTPVDIRMSQGVQTIKTQLGDLTTNEQKAIDYIFHQEPRVRIKMGGKELEFETKDFQGRKANPKKSIIEDKKVTYEEIFPNIDLVYEITAGVISEKFIVKKPLEIGEIEQNLIPKELELIEVDGRVSFYDKIGREVFKLEQPSLYEKDNPNKRSSGITFKIEKSGFGFKLRKQITDEGKMWLADPSRSYPVVIDPTVVTTSGASWPTRANSQRKVVKTSEGTYHFFTEGDWWTSTNQTSWTNSGIWGANDQAASAVVDSSDNIYIVYGEYGQGEINGGTAYDVFYRKFTKGAGSTWTMEAAQTVLDSTLTTTGYGSPVVEIEGTTRLWLANRYYDGTNKQVQVYYSNGFGTAPTWTVSQATLDTADTNNHHMPTIVRFGSNIGVLYTVGSSTDYVRWRKRADSDGLTTWDAEAVAATLDSTFGAEANYGVSATVDDSNNIHLAYFDGAVGADTAADGIKYAYYSTSWSTPINLVSSGAKGQNTFTSITTDGTAVWVLWGDATNVIAWSSSANTPAKIVFKKGVSPFGSGNFDASATSLYPNSDKAYDKVWLYNGTTYEEETTDADDTGTADVLHTTSGRVLLNVDDIAYFGMNEQFRFLMGKNSTSGSGGVVAREYWNGSSWASLTLVTSTAPNFTAQEMGWHFNPPADWAKTQVSTDASPGYYYIRARVTTGYTTGPIGSQYIAMPNALFLSTMAKLSGGDMSLVWSERVTAGTGANVVYATVPENLWLLLMGLPFLPKFFGRLNRRKTKKE